MPILILVPHLRPDKCRQSQSEVRAVDCSPGALDYTRTRAIHLDSAAEHEWQLVRELQRSGAVAQWRAGAMAQWRIGAVWRSLAQFGAVWRSGAVAQWRSGTVLSS